MKRGQIVTAAAIAVMTLIWGSTWAVIRVGLAGIPPLTGVAIRFGLAALVLFAIGAARKIPFTAGVHVRRIWITSALFVFTICYVIVYWGEQVVPSGLAAVLWSTFPLMVAFLARFLIPGERIRASTVAGMVIALVGIGVIYSSDFKALGGSRVLVASIIFLLSPLSSAFGNVLVKRWGKGVHPISITAVPMAITAVLVGILALIFERGRPIVFDLTSVAALLYLVLFGTAVTFGIYYWLLARFPATRLSLTACITPLIAILIGTLWMHEPLTLRILVGSALVLAGVGLALLLGARAGSRAVVAKPRG